jgi:hypothetical protein
MEYTGQSRTPQAKFNLAVALTQAGRAEEARAVWNQLVQLADSVRNDKQPLSPEYLEMKPLASKMLAVYAPGARLEELDEEARLMYLLYRKEALTEENRTRYASLLSKVNELTGQSDDPDRRQSEKVQKLALESPGPQTEALYRQAIKRDPLN